MIHFLSTDNRQRSTVFVQIVNLLFSDVSTTYYLFSLVSSTRLYHNFQFSIFNFQFSIFNFQFSIFNFQFSIRKTQQLHIVYFHRYHWYVSTIIFNFQCFMFLFEIFLSFLQSHSSLCSFEKNKSLLKDKIINHPISNL